jgi:hypothetical protein
MIPIDQFLQNIKKVKDPDFIETVKYAHINPISHPEKFKVYRKRGFDAVKYIKPILYSYLEGICGLEAHRKFPKSLAKQTALELELRRKAIPKVLSIIRQLELDISEKQVCMLVCHMGFSCYHDNPESKLCNQNFCSECKTKS